MSKIKMEDGKEEAKKAAKEEVEETIEEAEEEIEEELDEVADKVAEEESEKESEEQGEEVSEDAAGEEADSKEENSEEQESERYMRLMAEFQNFKRRAAKEKTDIHAFANERIVGDLLPVLDNFERALETATPEVENYAKGMELIFEQLKTALEKAGVEEIAALGEEFDPAVHNAVMTEQSEEYDDGKISKVLQKGYKLNGKVVRPAMVAVVKN